MMQSTIEIKHLSKKEKLRMMEALWEDLSREAESVDSPEWHKKALEETERRLHLGEEKELNWQTAKRDLRNRFE